MGVLTEGPQGQARGGAPRKLPLNPLPHHLGLARPQVLDSDFFLVAAKDAFMEAARQFLFENYCRIHQVGGRRRLL